eukprot:Ihof_evm1s473 gene=Ihof_evmTU1s473
MSYALEIEKKKTSERKDENENERAKKKRKECEKHQRKHAHTHTPSLSLSITQSLLLASSTTNPSERRSILRHIQGISRDRTGSSPFITPPSANALNVLISRVMDPESMSLCLSIIANAASHAPARKLLGKECVGHVILLVKSVQEPSALARGVRALANLAEDEDCLGEVRRREVPLLLVDLLEERMSGWKEAPEIKDLESPQIGNCKTEQEVNFNKEPVIDLEIKQELPSESKEIKDILSGDKNGENMKNESEVTTKTEYITSNFKRKKDSINSPALRDFLHAVSRAISSLAGKKECIPSIQGSMTRLLPMLMALMIATTSYTLLNQVSKTIAQLTSNIRLQTKAAFSMLHDQTSSALYPNMVDLYPNIVMLLRTVIDDLKALLFRTNLYQPIIPSSCRQLAHHTPTDLTNTIKCLLILVENWCRIDSTYRLALSTGGLVAVLEDLVSGPHPATLSIRLHACRVLSLMSEEAVIRLKIRSGGGLRGILQCIIDLVPQLKLLKPQSNDEHTTTTAPTTTKSTENAPCVKASEANNNHLISMLCIFLTGLNHYRYDGDTLVFVFGKLPGISNAPVVRHIEPEPEPDPGQEIGSSDSFFAPLPLLPQPNKTYDYNDTRQHNPPSLDLNIIVDLLESEQPLIINPFILLIAQALQFAPVQDIFLSSNGKGLFILAQLCTSSLLDNRSRVACFAALKALICLRNLDIITRLNIVSIIEMIRPDGLSPPLQSGSTIYRHTKAPKNSLAAMQSGGGSRDGADGVWEHLISLVGSASAVLLGCAVPYVDTTNAYLPALYFNNTPCVVDMLLEAVAEGALSDQQLAAKAIQSSVRFILRKKFLPNLTAYGSVHLVAKTVKMTKRVKTDWSYIQPTTKKDVVVFQCIDGTVCTSRSRLSRVNVVFGKMLEGQFMEAKQDVISLPGMKKAAFEALVAYLLSSHYAESIVINDDGDEMELVGQASAGGKRYKRTAETSLEEECMSYQAIEHFLDNLDSEVALDLIPAASQFMVPHLGTISISRAMQHMPPRVCIKAFEIANDINNT